MSLSNDETTVADASSQLGQLRNEIEKVFIGQSDVVEQVLIALLSAGHVLIEGVPGLGKTLLVKALSKAFEGQFSRIQFTPDLMPSDVTGHIIYNNQTGSFNIRKGPVFTHLLLSDEINRAPAKTQSSLLEVMQERHVTLEGKAMAVPEPFMVLATQNPIEQEGTYPLPEAQLDRFLMKINIDYPQENDEYAMVNAITQSAYSEAFDLSAVNTIMSADDVIRLQRVCTSIMVDQQINHYAVNIVRLTRQWPGISVGAGPRGGIALIRCARARALLSGRNFVIPDDVKQVAHSVLRHRIILAPELELEGQNTDTVIAALLEKVQAPRV